MDFKKILEKMTTAKGYAVIVIFLVGSSFALNVWFGKHFVTQQLFTSEFAKLRTAIKTDIKDESDKQFLILRKEMRKMRYSELSKLLFEFRGREITSLSSYELLRFRQVEQERCVIGKELGLLTACDK